GRARGLAARAPPPPHGRRRGRGAGGPSGRDPLSPPGGARPEARARGHGRPSLPAARRGHGVRVAARLRAGGRSAPRGLGGVGAQQRRRALVVVLTDFVEVDAASLVAPLALLARRHRVLLVALRDRAYEALAPTAPLGADGPLDLYRRIVLDELLREREAALGRLRRGGLET